MPDLYTTIAEQPAEVLDAVAASLEVRGRDERIAAICARYLRPHAMGGEGRAVEVGCGAGAATRHILKHVSPGRLVASDPSPDLAARAAEAFADDPRVEVRTGDALAIDAPEASADLVVAHTVYSHLTDPDAALAEAFRVLRPGGRLAILDGDYATITVALFEDDPLQAMVPAMMRHLIHGPYVMRSLAGRARAAGFGAVAVEAHGYAQAAEPAYLVSLVTRAADACVRSGEIGRPLAEGFCAEAAARAAEGRFYGAILFVSLSAEKPADA